MSENVIFCFSGTGNCLDYARTMAQTMGDTRIILIRPKNPQPDITGAKRVGFVVPCFGGGLPDGVAAYIRGIHIPVTAYRFAASLSASYPGVGLHTIDQLVHLDNWTTITHHCSCIWLFPHKVMLPLLPLDKAEERSKESAKAFAKEVMSCKLRSEEPPYNPLNALESAVWPKLAAKKAALLNASDACISCGQCEKLCPMGNITMKDGHPVFGNSCVQCLSCLQFCPKEAINMGRKTQKREHYHNPNITAKDIIANE